MSSNNLLCAHEALYIYGLYESANTPQYIAPEKHPSVDYTNLPTVGVDRNDDVSVMVPADQEPTLLSPDTRLDTYIAFTSEIE